MLVLIFAAIAALTLIWIGFEVFRSDPTSSPIASEEPARAQSLSRAHVPTQTNTTSVISEEAPKPAPGTENQSSGVVSEEPRSTRPTSAAAEVQAQSDALPPSPINEVLPDPPQSALDTIRGTVRVSIRVIVDKDGRVLTATSHDPGPSRYFERLSLEAAKKWTFTPAQTRAQREVLVRFNFRNEGTTAQVQAPQPLG